MLETLSCKERNGIKTQAFVYLRFRFVSQKVTCIHQNITSYCYKSAWYSRETYFCFDSSSYPASASFFSAAVISELSSMFVLLLPETDNREYITEQDVFVKHHICPQQLLYSKGKTSVIWIDIHQYIVWSCFKKLLWPPRSLTSENSIKRKGLSQRWFIANMTVLFQITIKL